MISKPFLAAGLATLALTVTGPPIAAADPSQWPQPGSQPADAILASLESMGYEVGINWINNGAGVPLERCKVTGYHAPGQPDPTMSGTVYVDVDCPDED